MKWQHEKKVKFKIGFLEESIVIRNLAKRDLLKENEKFACNNSVLSICLLFSTRQKQMD